MLNTSAAYIGQGRQGLLHLLGCDVGGVVQLILDVPEHDRGDLAGLSTARLSQKNGVQRICAFAKVRILLNVDFLMSNCCLISFRGP